MTSEVNVLNSIVKYGLSAILLITSSCSPEKEQEVIPEHIIDQEIFAEIMADITLIQSMKNLNATKEMMVSDSIGAFYLAVWEEYDISEAEFTESFDYYKKHPEMMAVIYAESARILKRLEKKAEDKAKENKNSVKSTTLDSLNDKRARRSKSTPGQE